MNKKTQYRIGSVILVLGIIGCGVPVANSDGSRQLSVIGVTLKDTVLEKGIDGVFGGFLTSADAATIFDRSDAGEAEGLETGIRLLTKNDLQVTTDPTVDAVRVNIEGPIVYVNADPMYRFTIKVSASSYADVNVGVSIQEVPYLITDVSIGGESLSMMGGIYFGGYADITTILDTSLVPPELNSGVDISVTTDPVGIDPPINPGSITYDPESGYYSMPVVLEEIGDYNAFTLRVQITEKRTFTVTEVSIEGNVFLLEDGGNSDPNDDVYVYAGAPVSDIVGSAGAPGVPTGARIDVSGVDPNKDGDSVGELNSEAESVSFLEGVYSFTLRAGSIQYTEQSISVVVIHQVALQYKSDPSVSEHNDKFSIGDLDNERLFIAQADYLLGMSFSYNFRIELGGSVVYERNGATVNGTTEEIIIGLPDLANDGSASGVAFTYSEYAAGQSIELFISDMRNSRGYIVIAETLLRTQTSGIYDLYTWRDLQNMRFDLSGNYTLLDDIVFPDRNSEGFPSEGFSPVGSYVYDGTATNITKYAESQAFRGSLAGQNKMIRNLSIYRNNGENYTGLFGYIGYAGNMSGSYIRDVHFVDPMVRQSSTSSGTSVYHPLSLTTQEVLAASYVGVLAGGITGGAGLISSDSSDSTIELENIRVGYTSGIAESTIDPSNADKRFVEGQAMVGSIVGAAQNGVSIELYASSDHAVLVQGGSNTGGLVGTLENSRLVATGATAVQGYVQTKGGSSTGGIVGMVVDHGFIGSESSSVRLTSRVGVRKASGSGDSEKVGGIAGYAGNESGIYRVSVVGGSNSSGILLIQSDSYVGGIVGMMEDSRNSTSASWELTRHVAVEGRYAIGGYIGEVQRSSDGAVQIVSENSTLAVTAISLGGGLIGSIKDADVHDSYYEGTVRKAAGSTSSTILGGLIGGVSDSDLGKVVEIYRSGVYHEGAGMLGSTADLASLRIGGGGLADRVGGIVGTALSRGDMDIREVYVHADVYGNYAGGITADSYANEVRLEDIRVSGQIVGREIAGGVVGVINYPGGSGNWIAERVVIDLGPGGVSTTDVNLAIGYLDPFAYGSGPAYTTNQVYYRDTLSLANFPGTSAREPIVSRLGVNSTGIGLAALSLGGNWEDSSGELPILSNVPNKLRQLQ